MSLRMNFALLPMIFAFFGVQHAFAQATFGAEFNFTNIQINSAAVGSYVNSPESESARDELMSRIKATCRGCNISQQRNHYDVKTYKIVYPDGWYFEIGTDPGVVEIQTKPSTTAEIRSNLKRIQSDIFDAAAAVGLLPATQVVGQWWASSHIHVGLLSSMGTGIESLRLLRNMMVDFSNHGEIADGIFTSDLTNAPPLFALKQEQRDAFAKIIADVDSGKLRSVMTFAHRIQSEVYYEAYRPELTPPDKYQAFNISRIGNHEFPFEAQTWELRAMRGQESAQDFLTETELFEKRLEYVRSHTKLVPLNLPKGSMTPEMKVANFYRYVIETGLDFKPYEKFLNDYEKALLPAGKIEATKMICNDIF